MALRNTPTTRVVCSTLTLAALLAFTAEHFDRTEMLTIAVWAVLWALAETIWYASNDKRGGARRIAIALAAAAAIAAWLLTPPKHETVTVDWHGPETLKELKYKLLLESYR